MAEISKGPLPLVVAVTGHTDIMPEDAARLGERVRALFEQLRRDYPHTEVQLLTPLAEGADRLAARVALDLGMPLIAAFPLEPDEYAKDFADPASAAEFEELRARAAKSFALPLAAGRPECYVQVGAFCVQHAHLLLALWDGVATNKPGGTSDIVRFCLDGVPRRYTGFSRLLDPVETGIVHHIVTPRASAPAPADAFSARWMTPDNGGEAEAKQTLREICGSTDTFNDIAMDPARRNEARRAQSEQELRGGAAAPDAGLARIARAFATADDLAIHFQSRSKRAIKTLFLLALGSVIAFEAFTDLEMPGAVFPYVLLSLAAYVFYVWTASRGFDDKHFDYRSLAEALRVQYYWRAAGIGGAVAEYYMRYRIRQSEWIRKALLVMDLHNGAPAEGDPGIAIEGWVEAQNAFFARAENRDHAHHHRLDRRAGVLAAMSFAGVVGLVVLGALQYLQYISIDLETFHKVAVPAGILAAGAAAIHGYGDKMALKEHTKRYARMHAVFGSALRMLKSPDADPQDVRDVLREAGREALEENADWVMLHRDRPLEPPSHGH